MTIESPDQLSQTAQLIAGREAEASSMNALRIENWRRRYWYRCVEVPVPREPPKWPAITVRTPVPSNVTVLRKAKRP